MTKEAALAQVAHIANELAEVKVALEDAVRAASAAGASLREIADVAEVSHTQVRRML